MTLKSGQAPGEPPSPIALFEDSMQQIQKTAHSQTIHKGQTAVRMKICLIIFFKQHHRVL